MSQSRLNDVDNFDSDHASHGSRWPSGMEGPVYGTVPIENLINPNTQLARRLFNKLAKNYDRKIYKQGYVAGELRALIAAVNSFSFSSAPRELLDLGCGTGLVGAELGKSYTVDGVDISKAMLLEASKKNLSESF